MARQHLSRLNLTRHWRYMYRIVAIYPCARLNKELTYLNYLLNYASIHASFYLINYHQIFLNLVSLESENHGQHVYELQI